MEDSLPVRRVQRVRHELRQREVEVVSAEPLGPDFISVTFNGDALADFISDSFDDHIKFMFAGPDGESVRRDYTPRRFDRESRTLTIEFACHGGGAAAGWARQAAAGQRAVIGGPRGSMIIPMDYDWHLLAGDTTALPAIRRRLGEFPASAHVTVIVQQDSAAGPEFVSAATLDLRRVTSADELLASLRAMPLPSGEGFVWCAGEAAAMASVRALLQEKGHPKEAMRIAAYWKRGAAAHHENLE
ncbi:MAG: NADPH-dependent ferric siderophore reductase [Burkholderia sp.]|nr:NADPH-dependent ferric siderophore reductase [Burkholderia sp.]